MDQSAERDFHRYFSLIVKWARIILLMGVLGGIGGFLLSNRQERLYQTSTTILVDAAPGVSVDSDYRSILTSELRARAYIHLLTTKPLLQAVIDKLGLQVSVGVLNRLVDVQNIGDTQLIRVQVRYTDRTQAAQIANTLVTIFADQIQQLQASRYKTLKESLSQQLRILERQIEDTNSQLTTVTDPPRNATDQGKLEASLLQFRQSYANALETHEQVQLAEAQTLSSVIQVEPATVPGSPISPRVGLTSSLSVVVGLLLGMGLVSLLEVFDKTVQDPRHLVNQTGLPILGLIGKMRRSSDARPIVVEQPRSPLAESFRRLRTNLQALNGDRSLRTILIASTVPDEGKTLVAVNLAAVLAQNGRQVTLVDANMRQPNLHNQLQVSNAVGLSDLLEQQVPLSAALQKTFLAGIFVLPSGQLPGNPAELVGSDRMLDLLSQLQVQADMVLVDVPPINVVTDALVLAQHVDGVLLVARGGYTHQDAFQRSVDQLRYVGANVLGIVFTDAPNAFHDKSMYRKYYDTPHAYDRDEKLYKLWTNTQNGTVPDVPVEKS